MERKESGEVLNKRGANGDLSIEMGQAKKEELGRMGGEGLSWEK